MEIYETEEQQVEAIKRWWKENGTAVVFGVVLGLGALWGWRYYNDSKLQNMEAASMHYDMVRAQLAAGDEAGFANAQSYIDNYSKSQYAVLLALELARLSVEKGDLAAAAQQLTWAKAHAGKESIVDLAAVRLARVQAAQQAYDDAIKTLDGIKSAGYASMAADIRGDVLLAKGDIEGARAAYQQAIAAGEGDTRLIQVKLDDLAPSAG